MQVKQHFIILRMLRSSDLLFVPELQIGLCMLLHVGSVTNVTLQLTQNHVETGITQNVERELIQPCNLQGVLSVHPSVFLEGHERVIAKLYVVCLTA